jgi:PhnB protein
MLTAYLTFNGNTEEAFNFYKSALGAEITNIQRFGKAPHGEQMTESDKQKIMHIALAGPYGMLMGNDHLDFMGEAYSAGNNFSLSVHPDTEEEATQLFTGLSEGGNIIVPLGHAPWGAFFGMFMDKFGVKWMINCHPKQ